MHWQTARFRIELARPKVMGIVNVTPDSFSDGGLHASTRAALAHCEELLVQGAHILDIGGESSRPGTPPVPLDEERARVMPVVREAVTLGVPISVDTYKPEIMREALDLGADIINDIWALRREGAIDAVAAHPGGPRIVDAIERALDLQPDALATSRAVFAGNGMPLSGAGSFSIVKARNACS